MDSERDVWKEAINVLGSEFVSNNMSSTEFQIVVQNHVDRFPKGGLVRDWLAGTLSSICRPRRFYLQVSMTRLFQKKRVGQNMHNLPKTNFDFRVPVVDNFVCVGIFANSKM